MSNFQQDDRVTVWGDEQDVVVVSGFSKDYQDNQGNPLVEIQSSSRTGTEAITPQALKKVVDEDK